MRRLGDEMGSKIARQATAAGIAVIKKRWKDSAPVAAEPHKERGVIKQPGNYRDNIVAKKVPQSQSKFTSEHLVVVRGGRKHGFASHEAALLEFGTVHISPRGYARRAYDETKEQAVEALKQKIKTGVEKA
jgi:HK97 gp10 family phage protein